MSDNKSGLTERERNLEKLYKRFPQSPGFLIQLIYWRKKISWILVVGGAKFIKRALDIVVSFFLLLVFFPFFILIGLLIRLFDGNPIFYVSKRVGLWGKEFLFFKFRTMEIDADKKIEALKQYSDFPESITFKMKHDPRTTKLGRCLRKLSLDELPQLWCVLKGDMSLVGPRPPLPSEVALYNLEQRGRLDVKPGLTCIWQVGGRSNIPFDRQVKMDKQYIESQSFLLDLKLLLKTIPVVLFGRGAS